jgi:hypothetical protein
VFEKYKNETDRSVAFQTRSKKEKCTEVCKVFALGALKNMKRRVRELTSSGVLLFKA